MENIERQINEYKESIDNDTLNLEYDTINDTLKLTGKEKEIINLIREMPDITISEIVCNTGFSRPTVNRALDKLKKANKIRRIGAKKNCSWEILK